MSIGRNATSLALFALFSLKGMASSNDLSAAYLLPEMGRWFSNAATTSRKAWHHLAAGPDASCVSRSDTRRCRGCPVASRPATSPPREPARDGGARNVIASHRCPPFRCAGSLDQRCSIVTIVLTTTLTASRCSLLLLPNCQGLLPLFGAGRIRRGTQLASPGSYWR